jgi:hypothetical protein
MKFADAMNTYNPALRVIVAKGYKVWIEPGDSDEELGNLCASQGDDSFVASDPLRLLALITLREELGESWNAGNENLYDKLLEEAFGQ